MGGLGLGHALLEFIHTAGGIHKFLGAGVEGMAGVADAQQNHGFGGAGFDHVAAGAADFRINVFWMNVRLHKMDGNCITISRDDKKDF